MPTLLEYQLELIKLEIETVNDAIGRMDDITKSVKEWTIGLWTGAVGGALVTKSLMPYLWLTSLIPLLFWLVDTWHRRIQRKFIWRSIAISKFLNDERLEQSFEQGKLVGFRLLDPKSRIHEGGEDYDRFISWRRIMLFRSLSIMYAGLGLVSLLLGFLYAIGVIKPVA